MWRLEIESTQYPSTIQIQRITKLVDRKFELRNEILAKLLTYYNSTARFDFELPELSSTDAIKYFLNAGSIYVPEDSKEPITISISTWDEEHGATYYYDDTNQILTEG